MALQKWAAPAFALQSTATDTGPAGSGVPVADSFVFAANADIAVGATMKIFAAGTITTTGSPTLRWSVGAFGGGLFDEIGSAPAVVTGQPWTIEATITVRSISGTSATCAYDIRATGLFATDVHQVGTTTDTYGAFFSLSVNWDSVADDADAGDTVSVLVTDALWIG